MWCWNVIQQEGDYSTPNLDPLAMEVAQIERIGGVGALVLVDALANTYLVRPKQILQFKRGPACPFLVCLVFCLMS